MALTGVYAILAMKVFLFLCCLGYSSGVIYELNDSDHAKMPNIIRLDPYEKCMRDPGAVYCTVLVNLVSDTPSPLLHMMEEYSADTPKHFNYTYTYQGVCVNQNCKGINSENLSNRLESCLNRTFWKEYRLKTKLMGQASCNNEEVRIDASDLIVAVLFLALIILNIMGTLYDVVITTGNASGGIKILLCFSIRRNFKKMINKYKECGPGRQQIKSLNGFRTLLIFMVILAHTLFFCIITANPHFIEKTYRYPHSMMIANGTLIMQAFFIISALLLVYNSCVYVEDHGYTWTMILKGTLMRWLRLTPAYAAVLAFTATWMRHVGTGPLWNMIVNVEVEDCRRNWWRHLIFISNYIDNSQCMIHSWYLAADMQLFLVGIVVVVFCRSKTSRIITLSTLGVVGFLLPAIHTYYQDLDGVLLSTLENGRTFFMHDKTFDHVYKRGHTNLLGYTIGLAVGYILYHWNDIGIDVNKYKKLRPLYWLTLPALFAIIYSGSIFYGDHPRQSLLFRVVYSALVKPVFCITLVAYMLGMVFKYENVYRSMLEWDGWTVPSKLSYCAYLLHFMFVRIFIGIQTSVIEATVLSQVYAFIVLVIAAFVTAVPLWLLVEAPVGELVKTLMNPENHINMEICITDLEPEIKHKKKRFYLCFFFKHRDFVF